MSLICHCHLVYQRGIWSWEPFATRCVVHRTVWLSFLQLKDQEVEAVKEQLREIERARDEHMDTINRLKQVCLCFCLPDSPGSWCFWQPEVPRSICFFSSCQDHPSARLHLFPQCACVVSGSDRQMVPLLPTSHTWFLLQSFLPPQESWLWDCS